jgi:hypothetical protein
MERQQAQAAELHRVLKAACPKYATECCLPAVPVIRPGVQPSATAEEVSAGAAPTPAPTKGGAGKGGSGTAAPSVVPHPLAPGLVVVQWHEQDGCWQDNESWVADGELGESIHRRPVCHWEGSSLFYVLKSLLGTHGVVFI